jgi:dihydrofolate reductase
MTLDGVIEDPANWVGDYLDESFQNAALERLMQTEAMLMGRRTYELLERDWAGQAGAFAERMSGIRKYVFSSTLQTVAWNNTVIVKDSVSRGAARLKKEVPGDISPSTGMGNCRRRYSSTGSSTKLGFPSSQSS